MSANTLSNRTSAALCLLFLFIALALRLHSLGEWSFAGDEVATLHEEQVLFHDADASKSSQAYRLPHAIPLGYAAIHLGHSSFGPGEFGTRVGPAIIGAVTIPIVFLLLVRVFPLPTAIAITVLLTVWPYHIYRSQEARFYIVAAFFSFQAMLFAAASLRSRSAAFIACAGLATALATLSHSVLIGLFAIIGASLCVAYAVDRRSIPKSHIVAFFATVIVALAIVFLYVLPFLRGWNTGEAWGYGTGHALLGSVAMTGWGIAVLAAVGALLMLSEGGGENWYWLTAACAWLAASVVLPHVVTYHPGYIFSLSLPLLVLAGKTVGSVYSYVAPKSRLLAVCCIFLFSLLSLPGLLSHYQDGSRWPLRDGAEFVEQRWRPGDAVAGFSMGTFNYYAKECCDKTIPIARNDITRLQMLAASGQPTWLVLESSRAGLGAEYERWLLTCAVHRAQIRKRRFDEQEYSVGIFMLNGLTPTCAAL